MSLDMELIKSIGVATSIMKEMSKRAFALRQCVENMPKEVWSDFERQIVLAQEQIDELHILYEELKKYQ